MKRRYFFSGMAAFSVLLFVNTARLEARDAKEWTPPAEICTADKTQCVKFVRTPLPDAPDTEDSTLEFVFHGKTLARYPTFGYILNGFWSPDKKYVAINNRRANGGDYLWILSGTDGKALKMPDDVANELGQKNLGLPKGDDHVLPMGEINKLCPNCTEDALRKYWRFATGWKNATELLVVDEFSFMHAEGSIDLREIFKIEGDSVVLTSQTIEKRAKSLRP